LDAQDLRVGQAGRAHLPDLFQQALQGDALTVWLNVIDGGHAQTDSLNDPSPDQRDSLRISQYILRRAPNPFTKPIFSSFITWATCLRHTCSTDSPDSSANRCNAASTPNRLRSMSGRDSITCRRIARCPERKGARRWAKSVVIRPS